MVMRGPGDPPEKARLYKKHACLMLFSENDHYVGDAESSAHDPWLTRGYGKSFWAIERDRPEGMKGQFKVSSSQDSMSDPKLITESWGALTLSPNPSRVWDEGTREYRDGPHPYEVITPYIPTWDRWQPWTVGRIVPLVAALVDWEDTTDFGIRRELLKTTDEICRFFEHCKGFGRCDSGGAVMEATYISDKAWGYLARFPKLFTGDSHRTPVEALAKVRKCRDTVKSGADILWAV